MFPGPVPVEAAAAAAAAAAASSAACKAAFSRFCIFVEGHLLVWPFHILSFGCCWFFGRWLFFSRDNQIGIAEIQNNTGASSSVTPYVLPIYGHLLVESMYLGNVQTHLGLFHVILVVLLFQDFRPFCFRKITTFQNLCSIDPVIFTPSHN